MEGVVSVEGILVGFVVGLVLVVLGYGVGLIFFGGIIFFILVVFIVINLESVIGVIL